MHNRSNCAVPNGPAGAQWAVPCQTQYAGSCQPDPFRCRVVLRAGPTDVAHLDSSTSYHLVLIVFLEFYQLEVLILDVKFILQNI